MYNIISYIYIVSNMNISKTYMDRNGRILIPIEIRKQYNMHPGDNFLLQTDDEEIKILNIDTSIDEMHALFFKHKSSTGKSVVEDFLSKKREEFKIEQIRETNKNNDRS